MNHRSRSTLFLIEQLIVIAIFALCAAVCARILTAAYLSARDARDISNALHRAESCAESFKATGGDFGQIKDILGGTVGITEGAQAVFVYYDNNWTACKEDGASYRLILKTGDPSGFNAHIRVGEISVERLAGDELYAITVAARKSL